MRMRILFLGLLRNLKPSVCVHKVFLPPSLILTKLRLEYDIRSRSNIGGRIERLRIILADLPFYL